MEGAASSQGLGHSSTGGFIGMQPSFSKDGEQSWGGGAISRSWAAMLKGRRKDWRSPFLLETMGVGDSITHSFLMPLRSSGLTTPLFGLQWKGNFIIQTTSEEKINAILTPGAWRVGTKVLIANRWRPGQPMKVEATNRVRIWISLPDFPMEMWRDEVFEDVAAILGSRFISTDQCTRWVERNGFEALGGEDLLPPLVGNEQEGGATPLHAPVFSIATDTIKQTLRDQEAGQKEGNINRVSMQMDQPIDTTCRNHESPVEIEDTVQGPPGFAEQGQMELENENVINDDFNSILSATKKSGHAPAAVACSAFLNFIASSNLVERSDEHFKFSWSYNSRVMVNRMRPILGRVISANQHLFLKGRNIQEYFLLGHEVFHSLATRKAYHWPSIRKFKELLGVIEVNSGLVVNPEKSQVVGFNVSRSEIQQVATELGWAVESLPLRFPTTGVWFSNYLAAPSNRRNAYAPNFCGGDDVLKRHFHLISWSKACLLKSEGGLGIRCHRKVNDAALAFLAVRALFADSVWGTYVRGKGIWMEGWSLKRDSGAIVQIVSWERNHTLGLAAMVKLRNDTIPCEVVKWSRPSASMGETWMLNFCLEVVTQEHKPIVLQANNKRWLQWINRAARRQPRLIAKYSRIEQHLASLQIDNIYPANTTVALFFLVDEGNHFHEWKDLPTDWDVVAHANV
ncbi:hypothetical protein EJ110_NYTH24641 [Nymphaea thermarum]|nr:hypothetical protein EJ110_NYTH24641 [Nymphaea thermarum]